MDTTPSASPSGPTSETEVKHVDPATPPSPPAPPSEPQSAALQAVLPAQPAPSFEAFLQSAVQFGMNAADQMARATREERAKDREHETRLVEKRVELWAKRESVMLEVEKAREPLRRKRENTILVLGVLTVLGVFGFLIYAVAKGALRDPVAALPTLALVVSTLAPLIQRAKDKQKPRDKKEEDDAGDADD